MENLETDLKYIEQLATRQDEAADNIADGISDLAGMTKHVKTAQGSSGIWWDHGVACFPGIMELRGALETRETAAQNVQAISTQLAENLREAVRAYNETDQDTEDNLDNQMVI